MPRQAIQINDAKYLKTGDRIVWESGSTWEILSNDGRIVVFKGIQLPGAWSERAAGLFDIWRQWGKRWEAQRA